MIRIGSGGLGFRVGGWGGLTRGRVPLSRLHGDI